jgi:hypothetical protein
MVYMVKEECDGLLLGAAGRACFPDQPRTANLTMFLRRMGRMKVPTLTSAELVCDRDQLAVHGPGPFYRGAGRRRRWATSTLVGSGRATSSSVDATRLDRK